MHVVLDCRYAYPRLSGIGRYALALAEGLASLADSSPALRVTLLVHDDVHLRQHLRGEHTHHLRRVPLPESPRDPRSVLRLPRLLRELRADLFHTPDAFAPLRPLQMLCPTVITVHDLIPLVHAAPDTPSLKVRLRPVWAAWVAAQAHFASAVLTPSHHSAADLRHHFRIAPRVIYPGVAAPPRPSQLAVTELQARLGLLGERYLLFVGRPEPYKNIEGLLHALHHLGPAFADVKLVLAGEDDPRFPGPRQLARRLGLQHRLHHTGHLDDSDLAALYAGAQALALVSHYEGFGYPPLEALALGTPVLASRVTSLPEVLADAAVYADPCDPADIARGLRDLLTSSGLRAELVRRGVARVARYTPQIQARQTLAVYRELLG